VKIDSQIIFILVKTIDIFFSTLSFLIVIRILISWLAPQSRGQIFGFIVSTTEPILGFFRRLNLRIGMLDLSPIVALLTLDFTRMILLKILFGL